MAQRSDLLNGLGFGVWGLGFAIQGWWGGGGGQCLEVLQEYPKPFTLKPKPQGSGLRVWGLGFRGRGSRAFQPDSYRSLGVTIQGGRGQGRGFVLLQELGRDAYRRLNLFSESVNANSVHQCD